MHTVFTGPYGELNKRMWHREHMFNFSYKKEKLHVDSSRLDENRQRRKENDVHA